MNIYAEDAAAVFQINLEFDKTLGNGILKINGYLKDYI
jgi:hypothetical protein